MSSNLLETTRQSSNGRQIPEAIFLEDVQAWIGGQDQDPEQGLTKLQQTLGKYQLMQSSSTQRKSSLLQKLPELETSIAMINQLITNHQDAACTDSSAATTTFELCDTLYATATLDNPDHVYIWLGANTMLSYPLDEADSLLRNKLQAAQSNLANVTQDLSWLRDQITVTEVNIARVYNWDVKRRRDLRTQQQQ